MILSHVNTKPLHTCPSPARLQLPRRPRGLEDGRADGLKVAGLRFAMLRSSRLMLCTCSRLTIRLKASPPGVPSASAAYCSSPLAASTLRCSLSKVQTDSFSWTRTCAAALGIVHCALHGSSLHAAYAARLITLHAVHCTSRCVQRCSLALHAASAAALHELPFELTVVPRSHADRMRALPLLLLLASPLVASAAESVAPQVTLSLGEFEDLFQSARLAEAAQSDRRAKYRVAVSSGRRELAPR